MKRRSFLRSVAGAITAALSASSFAKALEPDAPSGDSAVADNCTTEPARWCPPAGFNRGIGNEQLESCVVLPGRRYLIVLSDKAARQMSLPNVFVYVGVRPELLTFSADYTYDLDDATVLKDRRVYGPYADEDTALRAIAGRVETRSLPMYGRSHFRAIGYLPGVLPPPHNLSPTWRGHDFQ